VVRLTREGQYGGVISNFRVLEMGMIASLTNKEIGRDTPLEKSLQFK
jgi:hypothetical protein